MASLHPLGLLSTKERVSAWQWRPEGTGESQQGYDMRRHLCNVRSGGEERLK